MKYVHPDIHKSETKQGGATYTPPTECRICDIQFDSYYHYQVHYAKKVSCEDFFNQMPAKV